MNNNELSHIWTWTGLGHVTYVILSGQSTDCRNNAARVGHLKFEYIKPIRLPERHATLTEYISRQITMPQASDNYERSTTHKIN